MSVNYKLLAEFQQQSIERDKELNELREKCQRLESDGMVRALRKQNQRLEKELLEAKQTCIDWFELRKKDVDANIKWQRLANDMQTLIQNNGLSSQLTKVLEDIEEDGQTQKEKSPELSNLSPSDLATTFDPSSPEKKEPKIKQEPQSEEDAQAGDDYLEPSYRFEEFETPKKRNWIESEIDQDLISARPKTTFHRIQENTPNSAPKKPKNGTLDRWIKRDNPDDKESLAKIDDDNEFVTYLLTKNWHLRDFKAVDKNGKTVQPFDSSTRGKQRKKLPARTCKDCRDYFNAFGWSNQCKHGGKFLNMNSVAENGRHRDEFGKDLTQYGLWDADMASTQEEREHRIERRKIAWANVLRRLLESIEFGNYKLKDGDIQARLDRVDWQRVDSKLMDRVYEEAMY